VPVEASAGCWRAIGIRFIENNNRVGGLATSQGIGRGRQPTSVGGIGQPNKPINANWQARFLLSLVDLRNSQTSNLPLLALPIALLAGRWAVSFDF